jgi:hypothetical protein
MENHFFKKIFPKDPKVVIISLRLGSARSLLTPPKGIHGSES